MWVVLWGVFLWGTTWVCGEKADADPALEFKFECVVLSPEGQPLAGAEVFVCVDDPAYYHLAAPLIASGKTDEAGRFRSSIQAKPEWKFLSCSVIANAGGILTGFERIAGQAPWQTMASGKITLQPTHGLKMRILRPDGSPAEGLAMWVGGCSGGGRDQGSFPLYAFPPFLSSSFWSAKTDREGRCVIPSIPANTHIYLSHGGLEYAQFPGKHNIIVDALEADDGEHTLTLSPASVIRGRIVTSDGKPIPGVAASIIEHTPYVTAYGASVLADAEGRFELKQIPGSNYKLSQWFQPPAWDEWIAADLESIILKPGETRDLGDLKANHVAIITAKVLNKESGAEVEKPLVFRLPPGKQEARYRSEHYVPQGFEPESPDYTIALEVKEGERREIAFNLIPLKAGDVVTGIVLGPDGKPATKAMVSLAGVGGGAFPTVARTDEAGKFAVAATAKAARGFSLTAWGDDDAMSDLLPVKAGDVVTVKLQKDGFSSITGKVTDEEGRPLKGVVVRRRDGLGSRFCPIPQSVETDAEGRFIFARVWNNQTYGLSVKAKGYGSATDSGVVVGKGTRLEGIDFKLVKADVSLKGKVLDADGKPLANVWVTGYGAQQPEDLSAKTDEEGKFYFDHVVKGKLRLQASDTSFKPSRRVTLEWVAGADDAEVRLEFSKPKGAVAGIVVDEAGHPLNGAKISALKREVLADKFGEFQMGDLPQGWVDLQVEVSDPERGLRSKKVRVKTGTKDVRIVVPDKESHEEAPAVPK